MQTIAQLPVVHSTARSLTRRGVLWLGLKCDVRCKFCYDERLTANDKVWITFDEAAEALSKFRYFYHNRFVDFMGGEPTLHPHILDIVKYASDIGLRPTVITHGMHLSDLKRAREYVAAGVHDFLVSIHGLGETVKAIHGRGTSNFSRQMSALDNLRELGIPFRFNCTLIRDNLSQLEAIAELAGEKGARVVNFLTFNPYFEWSSETEIEFQARHSEISPYLARAIDKCTQLGVEANVRYMPPCQLPTREAHVYTGFQLPYDTHEWDYNSWYDLGQQGIQLPEWYMEASRLQQQRHQYTHVPACDDCAIKSICDGFHAQYLARWGGDEAIPFPGPPITSPRHFISRQTKIEYVERTLTDPEADHACASRLTGTQFSEAVEHRAGIKVGAPHETETR